MKIFHGLTIGFKNFANFSDISARPPYWSWTVVIWIINLAINAAIKLWSKTRMTQLLDSGANFGLGDIKQFQNTVLIMQIAAMVIYLTFVVPSLAFDARRLRDANFNPKLLLLWWPLAIIAMATAVFTFSSIDTLDGWSSIKVLTGVALILVLFGMVIKVLCMFPSVSPEAGNKYLAR